MTVVKINRLAVPAGQEAELEKRFAARRHSVTSARVRGLRAAAPGRGGGPLLRHHPLGRRRELPGMGVPAPAPATPSTTVSRAEGVLEFEVVELD